MSDANANTDTASSSSLSPAAAQHRRPWGLWSSLAWYVLIFEIVGRAEDYVDTIPQVHGLLESSYLLHSLNIIVAWGIQFFILVLAVRLTRIALRDYLAWIRPGIGTIAFGLAVIIALYVTLGLLSAKPAVDSYRSALAAGTSPWWYVLRNWPAIIIAPFVEESFFRGFLWRGVQARHGNCAAFVVSTLLFAAMHYDYWLAGGSFDPVSLGQYLVVSAILGWVRWRSGSTVASMIVHGFDNAALSTGVIVFSAILP
jgi:membrane protease YdiL (CAAX protease family)